VTDPTERTVGIRELLRMTSGAGQMLVSARTGGHWRVRIPAMTQQARQSRMICVAVLKLRIVETLRHLHLLLGRWFVRGNQDRAVNTHVDKSNRENNNGDG